MTSEVVMLPITLVSGIVFANWTEKLPPAAAMQDMSMENTSYP